MKKLENFKYFLSVTKKYILSYESSENLSKNFFQQKTRLSAIIYHKLIVTFTIETESARTSPLTFRNESFSPILMHSNDCMQTFILSL